MNRLLPLLLVLALAAHSRGEPPPVPGKTTPLFDGKTLEGWEGDAKLWRVEDGCLTGGSLTETVKRNDFLASIKEFGNFIVRFQIKLTGAGGFVNSGFQIRSQRVPKSSEMIGYQCDFGDPNWWGAIYDESRRKKVLSPADMAALGRVIKRNDWNEYVIRAEGPRITTWLNGLQATDYTEADASIPQTGKLGIQVHGGGKALVQVKEITIEELPAARPGNAFIGAPAPAPAAKASPLSPEEQRASFSLPPGFTIEFVASESEGIGKFVTVDWDQHGRMWSMTAFEYPVDGNENPAAAAALYANPGKDKVLVWDTPFAPGPQKPRIFADGLAIPLGILPHKNGCYVQHGPDIVFLSDNDAATQERRASLGKHGLVDILHGTDQPTRGDGRADLRDVILSGFGVQDSHLFPHQFTRAPGGWIWMAQGAFNYSKVKTPEGAEVQFDRTRMAKFRADGTEFDITSQGPCNIWGLVLNAEGEAFIQEANDFGYPVMPFHEYANYPGCSDPLFKSYAPEFPGTARDFKMGGTGLSGLALSDATGAWPGPYADVMYVANPITRRINAIKMHRDGPRWRLEKLPDLIASSDEWFRPIAIHFGPDGCLYIVDWYNKIISHNEVQRTHPDRDKTRGRIWRVKGPGQKPFAVPDFTKLSYDELLAKLGGESLRQSHLAWQTLAGREYDESVAERLEKIAGDRTASAARRIQALWALTSHVYRYRGVDLLIEMSKDPNRNVRREAVRAVNVQSQWAIYEVAHEEGLKHLADDPDPEVRAELIRLLGRHCEQEGGDEQLAIRLLISMGREPLPGPTALSTRNRTPIKVGEAYEREFERYLVRMFLERKLESDSRERPVDRPDVLEKIIDILDGPDAEKLPVESRLLASLALDPKTSAPRVAQLLPKLKRPPGQEEVLRLAEFPEEPGVGDALKRALNNPATRTGVVEALLAVKTRLDGGKLAPLLGATATALFTGDEPARDLAIRLAAGFRLNALEPRLVALVEREAEAQTANGIGDSRSGQEPAAGTAASPGLAALRALSEMGSPQAALYAKLARNAPDPLVRDEALNALASAKDDEGAKLLFSMWAELPESRRRNALGRLSATKPGAKTAVAALRTGAIAKTDLDGATVDKLQAVLGDDPGLAALLQDLGSLFRPVLALDGSDAAYAETGLTLDGPFTVETWVRLDPGIGNEDGILGAPGQLDINFFGAKLRVWAGKEAHDVVVAKKLMVRTLWTHVAVARDEHGRFKLYLDGELDQDQSKPAPQKFENVRVAWTQTPKGTGGALSEFRLWNRARTADEIRAHFDRSFQDQPKPGDLVFHATGAGPWGKLNRGAKVAKTNDFPPLLTQAEAAALDARFAKYRALAEKPGDAANGKLVTASCQACHLIDGQGANLAPNLSGAGAMGIEALLRNIITPNAAMENGYRIFRVELQTGDLVEGFLVSEDKNAVVLRVPGAEERRIARKDMRDAKFLRRSLMPEGLLDALTGEQVSDLFAYLKTLK